jgi:single-strand DNA-binding protein
MADINLVVLVGRLTRDAELKYSNTGVAITNLSLAVNLRTKKEDTWQDEGHFFDAVLIGRRAEALAQYLVKGKQVAIQGELRQNRWEQEGQRRSRVEVFVRDIQLLGGRSGAPTQEEAAPRERTQGGKEVPMADDFDDDIPF